MTTENAPHRLAARIKRRLAEDARTVEFGIDVDIRDNVIVLRGQVTTARRRALIEAVAREAASGLCIANDVVVAEPPSPGKPGTETEPPRAAPRHRSSAPPASPAPLTRRNLTS
jgi:hypothetical protein